MKKTVLKVVGKSKRKPLKHARKSEVLEDKFENTQGPIDTQHLLISTLLSPAVKMFIQELEKEDNVRKRASPLGNIHKWTSG